MKIWAITLALVCTWLSSGGQTAKYFVKIYGPGNATLDGQRVIQLSDGGYFICGNIFNPSNSQFSGCAIRTDSLGDTTAGWVRRYVDPGYTGSFWDMEVVSDGYVFVNKKQDMITSAWDSRLLKVDKNGNIIWDKVIGDSAYNDGVFSIEKTFDGGYLLVGWKNELPNPSVSPSDRHIWKVDSSGDAVWDKSLGGTAADDYIDWISPTSDSNYVLCGTEYFFLGSGNIWLSKIDNNGNTLWDTTYDFGMEDAGGVIFQTSDGGYILNADVDYPFGYGRIMKVDSIGGEQWRTDFLNGGAAVRILSDRNYIAYGFEETSSNNNDVLLAKMDTLGNILWSRTYGDNYNNYAADVQQTSDSGFIITGRWENAGGNADAFLIKTNCLGFTGPPVADFTYDGTGKFINQSDSAGHYKWFFGDGDTLEYDEFMKGAVYPEISHAYPDTGTYTVTLIASACGESDTVVKTVNITSVGIVEDTKNKNGAYLGNPIPNPFSSTTIIKAEVPEYVNSAELTIYDLTGRAVKTYKLQKGYNDIVVNTYDLNNGMYIYSMRADGKLVGNKKMIILK